MTDAVQIRKPAPRRAQRWRLLAGLWVKEWRQQRWRFFLGVTVLTGLLAGLLRAQLQPPMESALLIYWPTGVVLTIFLAMGSVASERAEHTWEFLLAQPVARGDILLAKWAWGLMQLLAMLSIATLGGLLALRSRDIDAPWQSLPVFAALAAIALSCWYTLLFLVLTRARNEFAAAIAGILLTIAVHVWLMQVVSEYHPAWYALNPLLLLFVGLGSITLERPYLIFWMIPLHIAVWMILPMTWLYFRTPKGGRL